MEKKAGTRNLAKVNEHPYIGKTFLRMKAVERRILNRVNKGRDYRGEAVITTYYLTAKPRKGALLFSGLEHAIEMILVHGTTEAWPGPGQEPPGYKKHMSWLKEVKFLGLNSEEASESAMVTISTPLESFDKKRKGVPLAQLRVATSSEPFNAFSDFTARVVDYRFPEEFKNRFLGQVWPHKRIREYLNVGEDEPMIGTIVKPKWLPRELFAQRVVEAANAGALLIKSDENLHLTKEELADYVSLTIKMLEENNFDLSPIPRSGGKRCLFAPHITVNPFDILEYAKIAVDCGANALCFSPHLSGDFEVITQLPQISRS